MSWLSDRFTEHDAVKNEMATLQSVTRYFEQKIRRNGLIDYFC